MNEKRPQAPPEWASPSMRAARTAFMLDLLEHTPPEGPRIPVWAVLRVREINKAALAMGGGQEAGPEWSSPSTRKAVNTAVFELFKSMPLDGANIPQWAVEQARALITAATISTPSGQERGPAGNGEAPGGAVSVAAVVLPFPAPEPQQLPPAAARRYQTPRPDPLPGDLQGGGPAQKAVGG